MKFPYFYLENEGKSRAGEFKIIYVTLNLPYSYIVYTRFLASPAMQEIRKRNNIQYLKKREILFSFAYLYRCLVTIWAKSNLNHCRQDFCTWFAKIVTKKLMALGLLCLMTWVYIFSNHQNLNNNPAIIRTSFSHSVKVGNCHTSMTSFSTSSTLTKSLTFFPQF